jgi:hypothetical protein
MMMFFGGELIEIRKGINNNLVPCMPVPYN